MRRLSRQRVAVRRFLNQCISGCEEAMEFAVFCDFRLRRTSIINSKSLQSINKCVCVSTDCICSNSVCICFCYQVFVCCVALSKCSRRADLLRKENARKYKEMEVFFVVF